jgi:hypothetical protein
LWLLPQLEWRCSILRERTGASLEATRAWLKALQPATLMSPVRAATENL